MQQNRTVQIRLVELLAAVRKKHDREFQSLGFVYGHDADGIRRIRIARRRHAAPLLPQITHRTHKGKQAAACARLKLHRALKQNRQIALTARAARHRAVCRHRFCLVQQLSQQFMHRQICGNQAPVIQLFTKCAHILPRLRRRTHRRVIVPVRMLQTDLRQLFFRKSEQRGAQDGEERQILMRIIQCLQQRQSGEHLRCLKDLVLRIAGSRDAVAQQCFLIDRHAHTQGAHQNDKILRTARAQLPRLLVRDLESAVQHSPDFSRTEVRLELNARGCVLVIRSGLEQTQLRAVVLRTVRIRRTRIQCLALGVVQIAELFAHDVGKQRVDASEHLRAGTEVFRQHDAPRCVVKYTLRIAECLVFLQKDPRIRLTEPVNTLFDVADHEDVLLILAHGAENRVLYRVGILIFVHHDLGEMNLLCKTGRRSVLFNQQCQCIVLQIVEIQQGAALFLRVKRIGKLLYRVAQCGNRRCHSFKILPDFFFLQAENLFRNFLRQRLPQLAHVLEPLQKLRVGIFPHRAQPFSFSNQRAALLRRGIPRAVPEQGQQCLGIALILLKRRTVFLLEIRIGIHLIHRTAQDTETALGHRGRLFDQLLSPRRVRKPVKRRAETVAVTHQLRARIGRALQGLIGLQHDIHQFFVIPSCAHDVGQQIKALVLLSVAALEHLLQYLGPDMLGLTFVQHAEIRRQSQLTVVLAQERHTVGMHRRDLRPVHQHELTAQMHIVRMPGHQFGQRLGDLAAHLARRGASVGHDEERVDIARILRIGDAAQNALDEHRRLSRTGRRRNQQGAAAVVNDRALLFCPVGSHHISSFPLCSIASQTSSAGR